MDIFIPDSHPAFPQPPDLNVPIWRYMTFDKFESLLTMQRLYFRRADMFPGDLFEGTTPAGDIAAWERAAANAATPDEGRQLLLSREQLAEYAQHYQQNLFINCWHLSEHENVAMWERYTKGETRAVAVKARYGVFKELLRGPVIEMGMVRYIDYDADPLPSVNMMERIMHKRNFYRDEREVRAVMCAVSPDHIKAKFIDPHLAADGYGWMPPVDVKTLTEGIILHPSAPSDFSDQVASLCATHSIPSPQQSAMSASPRF
jgi:hypothetical protein